MNAINSFYNFIDKHSFYLIVLPYLVFGFSGTVVLGTGTFLESICIMWIGVSLITLAIIIGMMGWLHNNKVGMG